MPIPARGSQGFLQIGRESTFGTPVAATKRFEMISASINPEMGTILDPSLNAQASRRGIYQGGILYRGNFVVRANYEGLEELLKGVMGASGYTLTQNNPSPLVNTHEFKESLDLHSYTLQLIEGKPKDQNICAQLAGSYLTRLAVRGTAGQGAEGMLQIEFGVIAQVKNTGVTPTAALTAPAIYPVLYHQGLTMDPGNADAAADVRIRNFEMVMESPHTDDRFYIGSVNQDQPLRSDFMSVRWRFGLEYVTDTILTALKAGTIGSPQLVFQHPTIITGAHKREFEIRSATALYTEDVKPVEGYGPIVATAAMEAYNDGTGDNSALYVRTKNQMTTVA